MAVVNVVKVSQMKVGFWIYSKLLLFWQIPDCSLTIFIILDGKSTLYAQIRLTFENDIIVTSSWEPAGDVIQASGDRPVQNDPRFSKFSRSWSELVLDLYFFWSWVRSSLRTRTEPLRPVLVRGSLIVTSVLYSEPIISGEHVSWSIELD